MKKALLFLEVVFVVAVLMKLFALTFPYFAYIYVCVGITLAILFFLEGKMLAEKSNLFFISALGAAVSVVGIVFRTQHWPSSLMMLQVGIVVLLVSMLILVLKLKTKIDKMYIIKNGIVLVLALLCLLFVKEIVVQ